MEPEGKDVQNMHTLMTTDDTVYALEAYEVKISRTPAAVAYKIGVCSLK